MRLRNALKARALVDIETSNGMRWQVRPVDGKALIPHGGAVALASLQTAYAEMQSVREENQAKYGIEPRPAPTQQEIASQLSKNPDAIFDLPNMAAAYVCAGVAAGSLSPEDEFEALVFVTTADDADEENGIMHVQVLGSELIFELAGLIREVSEKGLDLAGFRKASGDPDADSSDSPQLRAVAE